jgi:hypothetical protein
MARLGEFDRRSGCRLCFQVLRQHRICEGPSTGLPTAERDKPSPDRLAIGRERHAAEHLSLTGAPVLR